MYILYKLYNYKNRCMDYIKYAKPHRFAGRVVGHARPAEQERARAPGRAQRKARDFLDEKGGISAISWAKRGVLALFPGRKRGCTGDFPVQQGGVSKRAISQPP